MLALLRITLLACLTVSTARAAETLIPPPGYSLPVQKTQRSPSPVVCPPFPAPFTGALLFTSKYAGSDRARATLNPQAEREFRQQTYAITQLEKQVSQQLNAWQETGYSAHVACVVNGILPWAQADALTSTRTTHTGKAIRKWALASLSSAWLQLQFSPARPLAPWASQSAVIARWLGKLGSQTVTDWAGLPPERTNNHSYWAAWAMMSTAVVTNRQDLFREALSIYRTAATQVDDNGFLPNELRRRQRAFSYHNYAVQPLVMVALFARSNGVDVTQENHAALQRLATRVIAGFADSAAFAARAGVTQSLDFTRQPGNLAWLEVGCQLTACSPELQTSVDTLRPLHNTRLGGNITRLYALPAAHSHPEGN